MYSIQYKDDFTTVFFNVYKNLFTLKNLLLLNLKKLKFAWESCLAANYYLYRLSKIHILALMPVNASCSKTFDVSKFLNSTKCRSK